MQGILNECLYVGGGSFANEVIFHLVNCSHIQGPGVTFNGGTDGIMGRILLQAEQWTITIDPVINIDDLIASLKATGGYAITHVGKITRTDCGEFKIQDCDDILMCLRHLLSFAHGAWITPILSIAQDNAGKRIREEWGNRITSKFVEPTTWFSDRHAEILPNLFPNFLKLWRTPLWNETLRRTIWWYVSSCEQAGGLDGAIVLVQVALELLAWVLYVEEGHIVSTKGFEELPAADKLRLLAFRMNVPLSIPPELNALRNFSDSRKPKCEYGLWAFTDVRNALVHPKNRNILDSAHDLLFYDAWRLGLWHLELAVLHACDYRGFYCNRIHARWSGEIERVPWA